MLQIGRPEPSACEASQRSCSSWHSPLFLARASRPTRVSLILSSSLSLSHSPAIHILLHSFFVSLPLTLSKKTVSSNYIIFRSLSFSHSLSLSRARASEITHNTWKIITISRRAARGHENRIQKARGLLCFAGARVRLRRLFGLCVCCRRTAAEHVSRMYTDIDRSVGWVDVYVYALVIRLSSGKCYINVNSRKKPVTKRTRSLSPA